ncbi:MAG: prepilin-type N-terminal cleavage/methylation domain-containing protein [Deltaproteobacteria bacterium]|nr:prepilin-type N-terminal cleavage/methylation domain-containing protein [Deltaproteobacteria bacterium]TLN03420.1 MAG: prepilin-type N-terminal cleavage/methylation domain-containing protein [bacterium]
MISRSRRRASAGRALIGNGNNRGFTLLELLVALVLLVLLSGALYGTYFSVMRGSEAARERTEPLRDARVAIDLLRRELAAAFYTTTNKRLHFIVEDRDIFGKPASILDFTAFTVPKSGSVPSSDVMAVRYRPVEKEGQKMILSRQTQDFYLDSKPLAYPLTEQIEGFLVECYDGNQWVKSWDTTLNTGLPKAVRVTLLVQGSDKPVGFTAIVVPRLAGS